jgi:hypothetical protein
MTMRLIALVQQGAVHSTNPPGCHPLPFDQTLHLHRSVDK